MTNQTGKPENNETDDAPEFDMYRFFSRLDVLAVILVIMGLLLYALYTVLFAPGPAV
ncbi:MAG: hypothetical protein LRY54_01040 [Alphaproteobacteria bacterium]|nr:hypothetical protein [Alphaproteobacteria bacterium]